MWHVSFMVDPVTTILSVKKGGTRELGEHILVLRTGLVRWLSEKRCLLPSLVT